MSLADTIADDYTIFDETETVTLTPQNPAATADSSVTALFTPISQGPIAGGIVGLESKDMQFTLFGATLTPTPKNGDKITRADATTWLIKSVDYDHVTRTYFGRCTKTT